ncbi:MAG: proprotein convertase P-domain-containing protein [Bdellovibrionota bacterium]
MKRFIMPLAFAVALPAFGETLDKTSCFPENNLNLEDRIDRKDANIDEAKFNEIISKVEDYYAPIISSHGATLRTIRNWADTTVNAYAQQNGTDWQVSMFGGLARRPEVTPDGFALVVCHEVGHHLAGFPFYDEGWASSEGQSDYFATQACASNIWKDDIEDNALYRDLAPQIVKDKCDASYSEENRQNLCYRTSMAGKSLGELLAALGSQDVPRFDTPDQNVVNSTVTSHPQGQCRFDTYFQGALCNNSFDEMTIPGRSHPEGQGSFGAETDASRVSCTTAGFYSQGTRPLCWFHPRLNLSVANDRLSMSEMNGNGNDVWEPGETFALNLPLVNNLLAAIAGAQLSITRGEITVTEAYPTIEAGASAYAVNPIQITAPAEAQCGEQMGLVTKVSVNNWENVSNLSITLGEGRIEEVENTTRVAIPDNDRAGVTSSVLGTSNISATKAFVALDITHTYIGDLKVELISPAGNSYVIHNNEGGGDDNIKKTVEVSLSNESISGSWKLKVVDSAAQDNGTLNSWGLTFNGLMCGENANLALKK